MAHNVIMPKMGVTVTECILSKWYKQKGETVAKGDSLFSYETDKTVADESAPADGVILEIYFEEGDVVPCLERVCVIGVPGEAIAETGIEQSASKPEAPSVTEPVEVRMETETQTVAGDSYNRPYTASPRARLLAERLGLDLDGIVPTGAENRIISQDVEKKAVMKAAQPAVKHVVMPTTEQQNGFTDTKMSNVRKIIAKRMTESLHDIPQLTHSTSFNAEPIQKLRAECKACDFDSDINRISINDMIMFAVSRVLMQHPLLNAHVVNGDTLRVFDNVNLGMAVDTDRGLLVPVLKDAQKYSLLEMSKAIHSLIDAARSGSISPDDLNGATFTVSNLGSMKVEHFTPIVNAPQTGILGVCCPTYRNGKAADGGYYTYTAIGLSLTYDHRAVDGAPASRFLMDLTKYLENFYLMQMR